MFRVVVCDCAVLWRDVCIFDVQLESARSTHSSTEIAKRGGNSYTTICLRASRGLRMNLRVRRVTGVSAMLVVSGDAGMESVYVDFQFSCGALGYGGTLTVLGRLR